MIVHKVNHKRFSTPLLSELETPLSSDVSAFLIRQIGEAKKHKNTRDGVFSPQTSNTVSLQQLCTDLIQQPNGFVVYSRAIAEHLFNCVKKDKRVSSGDLVVLTFTENGARDEWVALLKMDEEAGFVGEPNEVDGKSQIVLRKIPNILTNNDLQKCAFVLPAVQRTERRHLVVLDQQMGKYNSRQAVASFFISKFLQCKVGRNALEKTRIFYQQSVAWLNGRKGEWEADQIETFEERIKASLEEPLIDVEATARACIENQQEQEKYLEHMKAQLQQAEFEDLVFIPDRKFLSQTQYVRYKGDYGLEVRIQASAVGKDKALSIEYNAAENKHYITIRTTLLEPPLQ